MYPFPNQPQPHQHYPPQTDFPPPTQQPQQPQQHPPSSSQHTGGRDRDQSRDPPLPTPHRPIGVPLNFSTGQFSGKHVRAELIELQKADLGRKYASNPVVPSPASCADSFTRLFSLIGTLAKIAGPSTHHLLCNSNFFIRILAPRDPIQRLRIMS